MIRRRLGPASQLGQKRLSQEKTEGDGIRNGKTMEPGTDAFLGMIGEGKVDDDCSHATG